MNALFLFQRVVLALAAALLCACAGAPSVSPVESNPHYVRQQGKGVFYFLPRTELELQLEVSLEDVIPGPLSSFVETCSKKNADPLCEAEKKFDFKPVKANSEHQLCETSENEKTTVERYYSLGDKTQLTGVAVPDAKRLYFVEVTPAWYQTINASLQYGDTGLLSEMTAGGSNAVGEAAVKLVTAAAGVLMSTRDRATDASEFGAELARLKGKPKTVRENAIDELNRIRERRDHIVFNAPINGDASPILAALDASAAKIRALYEGKLKTDSMVLVRRVTLRPDNGDDLNRDIAQLTSTDDKVAPIELTFQMPGCSRPGADPEKAPLELIINLEPEKNALTAALAQDGSAPTLAADQQGFRYRVPIPVKATLHKKGTETFTEHTRLVNKEFSVDVAQLGPTLTLPRKPGVWGGTVGAAFVAGTGRLKTFKTDAGANVGATIVNQVGEFATKDRKMEALEKEEHELDLRTKIKAHKDALNKQSGE